MKEIEKCDCSELLTRKRLQKSDEFCRQCGKSLRPHLCQAPSCTDETHYQNDCSEYEYPERLLGDYCRRHLENLTTTGEFETVQFTPRLNLAIKMRPIMMKPHSDYTEGYFPESLLGYDLSDSNFFGRSFSGYSGFGGCRLDRCDFSRSRFDIAVLPGENTYDGKSQTHYASFSNTSMKEVKFDHAYLCGVTFYNCDLNGASFLDAKFTKVKFRRCNLKNTHLTPEAGVELSDCEK